MVDGGFDGAKDMCDHFACNPSNTGWTSTGGGVEKNRNLKPEHMPAGAGWVACRRQPKGEMSGSERGKPES